jgi:hypothetical protein
MSRRIAAAMLLTLTACSSKIGPRPSPALLLDQVNSLQTNVDAGQEFTYAVVLLRSTSDSPVTIRSVKFDTPKGIGGVVKPLEVDLAHLATKDDWPVRVWSSFPPTAKVDGRCQAQELEPAAGAVIPPNAAARLVVLFRAVHPGDFYLGGQDVTYSVDGAPGDVDLPNRYLGTVTKAGGTLEPEPIETTCAKLGNLLPTGSPPAG